MNHLTKYRILLSADCKYFWLKLRLITKQFKMRNRGMNNSKYVLQDISGENEGLSLAIVNLESSVPIPDDEPVFILRAKDPLAIKAIAYYKNLLPTPMEREKVSKCMADFAAYEVPIKEATQEEADREEPEQDEPETE